jgi:thiamine biosynthesis protein ThiS
LNIQHPTSNAIVTANGKTESVYLPCSLAEFLQARGLDPRQVAVERNGEVVFKSNYASIQLADGDRLEIIKVVAGG